MSAGDWVYQIDESGRRYVVINVATRERIAEGIRSVRSARCIAATPDLFDACKRAAEAMPDSDDRPNRLKVETRKHVKMVCRAAVTKATKGGAK